MPRPNAKLQKSQDSVMFFLALITRETDQDIGKMNKDIGRTGPTKQFDQTTNEKTLVARASHVPFRKKRSSCRTAQALTSKSMALKTSIKDSMTPRSDPPERITSGLANDGCNGC
jgi:hypothetical protein